MTWVEVQKIFLKMYPASCTNHFLSHEYYHHDVIDFVNHGMVENTKTWISWEQNITFLWNKKKLNCASDDTFLEVIVL